MKLQTRIYHSAFDNEYVTASDIASSPEMSTGIPEEMLQAMISNSDEPSTETKERERYESVSSEGFGSDDGNTAITAEDLEIQTPHASDNTGTPAVKHFYFYQGEVLE